MDNSRTDAPDTIRIDKGVLGALDVRIAQWPHDNYLKGDFVITVETDEYDNPFGLTEAEARQLAHWLLAWCDTKEG